MATLAERVDALEAQVEALQLAGVASAQGVQLGDPVILWAVVGDNAQPTALPATVLEVSGVADGYPVLRVAVLWWRGGSVVVRSFAGVEHGSDAMEWQTIGEIRA